MRALTLAPTHKIRRVVASYECHGGQSPAMSTPAPTAVPTDRHPVPPVVAGAREDGVGAPVAGYPDALTTGALKPTAMAEPCTVVAGGVPVGLLSPPDPDTPDDAPDEPPIPVLAAAAPLALNVDALIPLLFSIAVGLNAVPATVAGWLAGKVE